MNLSKTGNRSLVWNEIISKGINTLRPGQNGRHFPGDIFKGIFLKENLWISIKISLKFVFNSQINNIPALVQVMAWRRRGDKPLSEPIMINLLTYICFTRPQWFNPDTWECISVKFLRTIVAILSPFLNRKLANQCIALVSVIWLRNWLYFETDLGRINPVMDPCPFAVSILTCHILLIILYLQIENDCDC